MEWLRLVSSSPELDLTLVDAESLRQGALKGMDILVCPGGSSPAIKEDLGDAGAEAIRSFIRAGGGYIGTCAGCCLLMDEKTDPERGIGVIPFHRLGNKGHAIIPISLNDQGAEALGLTAETRDITYSRGPVLVPVPCDDPLKKFKIWGNYEGDLDSTGFKFKKSMKGKVSVVGGTYGKGRVFAITCHPESLRKTWDIVQGAFRYVGQREVTFPEREKRSFSVGWFASPVAGITDAQAALMLEADAHVEFSALTKTNLQSDSTRQLKVIVLPDGSRDQYEKSKDALEKVLPQFIARGTKVLAWGMGANYLPAGGESFRTAGDLVRQVSELARQ